MYFAASEWECSEISGMIVRAHHLRAFERDGAVAEGAAPSVLQATMPMCLGTVVWLQFLVLSSSAYCDARF